MSAMVIRGGSSFETARGASPPAIPALQASASTTIAAMAETARTFAKFTFFKLDPAWQRRDPEARAEDKREFLAACEDFGQDRSLRAYSTVGTRGDTDLVLLSQSAVLEDIHTFHVVLAQSGLAKWARIPYSYLAMTKRSPYSDSKARPEICTSDRRYLFVYPFEKKREWYRLPEDERQRIMDAHIAVGRRYPEIAINTTYSFGLDDQEFVVSFEADEPGEFLDLVQELRGTESSAYTLRDTPIFTCVAMSVAKALDALDGAATACTAPALA
jgi:chlorite dismutase